VLSAVHAAPLPACQARGCAEKIKSLFIRLIFLSGGLFLLFCL
jgi:hypothetical protein